MTAKAKAAPALKRATNKKWEDLLAYHLQLHGMGQRFVREYIVPEFGRKWGWDFADPAAKVLIEVQGAIWIPQTGHNSGAGLTRDYDKGNTAAFHGWTVLHFTDKHIKTLEAVNMIGKLYQRKSVTPDAPPSPF